MNVIGIGTDIVEIVRIARMIERHGELFLHRVYTPFEIGYCSERKAALQHYAGRWAAKEAVLKTLGTGWAKGIRWVDIEVRNDISGQPRITLQGAAMEISRKQGIDQVLISISHCQAYATAYALGIGSNDDFEG